MKSQNVLEKKATQVRQAEIVQAALGVIGRLGVSGLTIHEVAVAASMSEANIYRHFRNKQDVIRAVVEFIGSQVTSRAAQLAGSSGKPLDKLEKVILAHSEMIARNPGIPRLLFSDGGIVTGGRIAQIMASRIESFQATLTGLLEAAVAEGALRDGIGPRETAVTIMGILQFSVLRWIGNQAEGRLTDEVALLWANFRRLLERCDDK
ncbi:MAG: TetR/AcrR family transcriptional regulator [Trichlorobacter sp.]|uniref:TetR/AcrR family transcriptional regulator n=1 Tax=Trichlorobacter sp. TaxID=2911007 RepID=UPI0025649117|nr:TetR/AcrR family transcriptional regulator [Trichlorobacter sp.]MDK9718376.1 TetR/AcrR family transcriptional regulator [Trichlorobacter sp.]